jgi:hypothetical protein
MRYLEAAWNLTQSGAVANRMARIYEKAGDMAKAKHLLLLAVAAGGADVDLSRARLAKLAAGRAADLDVTKGQAELAQMQSVRVRGLAQNSGQAEFILVFDGSSRPQRAEFHGGTPEMRNAETPLTDNDYPVSFPESTSVKIVRRGVLSCSVSGCALVLKPPDSAHVMPGSGPQAQK